MTDRREAIVRLLDTRFDHLPEQFRSTIRSASGFVHRAPARTSCPDCLANDRVSFHCETCHGRGYVEAVRERDPYATDHVLPYGFTPDRHEAARSRDRDIAVLERQLEKPLSAAEELAAADAHPYVWEQARRRMYRLFDYAALDRALDALRNAFPGVSAYSDQGLVFLDERMPDPVRAPDVEPARRVRGALTRGAGPSARELRDMEIRARAAAGVSAFDVAEEFGVSVRTVYDVCKAKAA